MQEFLAKILQQQSSTTTIQITHDVEEALFLSDRLIVTSNRPMRVLEEVPVPFPRPRLSSLRFEPDFIRLKKEVLRQLTGQVS